MPPAPSVRDLQAAIAQENAALKPQQELLDTQMTANEQSGQAQQAGLAAQQKTTFGQIEQGAQNKGMFFSGFTPDEQAKYTANTYLPALANLQAAIANTRTSLLGKKADLSKAAYDKASALVENDKNLLADWNKMTAQQQFQATEAEKQRVYDATQREKERNFTASQNAANRSAQYSASQVSAADKRSADIAGVSQFFRSVAGGDKFVHQQDYAQAKQMWTNMGYSGKEFDTQFSTFRNPKNNQYGLG